MKVFQRRIPHFYEDAFFRPVRNKVDYARLLALSAQLFLIEYDTDQIPASLEIKLVVDKMNRVFVYKENKIFSISFPFLMSTNVDGNVE